MPVAKLADMVIARVDPAHNNGAVEAPAVVTRIYAAALDSGGGRMVQAVNVQVFRDGHGTEWIEAVPLFDTEADAIADGSPKAAWPLGTSSGAEVFGE